MAVMMSGDGTTITATRMYTPLTDGFSVGMERWRVVQVDSSSRSIIADEMFAWPDKSSRKHMAYAVLAFLELDVSMYDLHNAYPHEAGTRFGCSACETMCHCWNGDQDETCLACELEQQ